MIDKKVEVIITQERYNQLLRKEGQLNTLRRENMLTINVTYLDTRIGYNTLEDDVDELVFKYDIAEGIPKEIQQFIDSKVSKVQREILRMNEQRLAKLDGLKEQLRWEFKLYKKDPKQIPWFKRALNYLKREDNAR